jgi:hypothetical protein
MEDHQGELVLEDREPEGARVKLIFAAAESRTQEKHPPADRLRELSTIGHGL